MKKLVYAKQDVLFVAVSVNGHCSFCGLIKESVANTGASAICKDCSKQITRILTRHGPAAGQIPADGAMPNGAF